MSQASAVKSHLSDNGRCRELYTDHAFPIATPKLWLAFTPSPLIGNYKLWDVEFKKESWHILVPSSCLESIVH